MGLACKLIHTKNWGILDAPSGHWIPATEFKPVYQIEHVRKLSQLKGGNKNVSICENLFSLYIGLRAPDLLRSDALNVIQIGL
jgi:hypothetical protein